MDSQQPRDTVCSSDVAVGQEFVSAPPEMCGLVWRCNGPPPAPTYENVIVCMRCGERGHVRPECSRFRTRMCIHFQNGCCHDGDHCSFAHYRSELRDPLQKRCVRVVSLGDLSPSEQRSLSAADACRVRIGDVLVLGCNQVGKNYSECCGLG